MAVALDRKDIQALVVSSYKHLPCAAFLLGQVKDAPKARLCLGQILREITTSDGRQAEASTNLAFTWTGLKNLGLSQDALATFSLPFQEGMSTPHRSRILGDTDDNLPSQWEWGGQEAGRVDVLLLIYSTDEVGLKSQIQARRAQFVGSGGFSEVALLEAQRQPDDHEHFGFNDGIGSPLWKEPGTRSGN